MTQEQNKKLAKWAEIKLGELADLLICNERYIGTPSWDYDIWHPDKDSNQLDLLWEKFIKELNTKYKRPIKTEITLSRKGDFYITRVFTEHEDSTMLWVFYSENEGKTESEAKLKILHNYIKGLKQ